MINLKRILSTFLLLVLVAAVGGGCTRSARRDHAIAGGDQYLAAGDYDKAEASYTAAAKMMSPPSPVALRQLGLLYAEEGRLTGLGVYCLQQASNAEPDNIKVLVELAAELQDTGRPADAKGALYRALKLQPGHERALVVLCDTARSVPECEQTRQYIEKLRQQDKDRASYHLAFGLLDAKEGNFPNAETEFRQSLALDTNSIYLGMAMANLDLANGDVKTAEQIFKTTVARAPWRSQARMQYAKFQFQHGETNQAAQSLQEVISHAPDFMPASLMLMKFDFVVRKFEDCDAMIAKILARDPENLEALVQRGEVSLAKQDGKQAVTDFEYINSVFKRLIPQVQYELAKAYVLSGNANKAVATLSHELQVQTNDISAKLLLARLEIRQGNAASAITRLSELLKLPHLPVAVSAEASLTLASAYTVQNVPSQAVAIYRRMEETFAKSAQLPYLDGLALAHDSQPDAARAEFEKALALDPGFLPPLEELIDLELTKSNYVAAGNLIKKEMERNPTNAIPWLLQAKICLVAKEDTQAEAALQKAITLDPKLPAPYLLLARLYEGNHQPKEALDKLHDLLAVTNNVVALMAVGEIQDQDKDFAPARQSYEQILTLDPKYSAALNNLAYLDAEYFNDLDKAETLAEKNRELSPSDPYVADTLGWILFRKGEYPRALSLEEESAAKQPGDAEVQYHLGMAHYMMGEEDPARAALQVAVSKSDFAHKEEAQQRLALLAIEPKTATPAERAEVDQQLKKEPADPVAMMRQAELQERDGAPEKAAATYEAVITKNSHNFRAKVQLAQLYANRLNQPQKGLELAKSAHQEAPDDPSVAVILGRLVFQTHDYPYALSLLQAAARAMPSQPDLLHDVAWAFFATGDSAQASNAMESAVQTSIPFAKLEDAKKFLSMLEVCADPGQSQADGRIHQVLQTDTNYAPAWMALGLVQEKQGHPKDAEASYEKVLAAYPLFAPADRQLAILYARDGNNDAKAANCAEKARPAFPADAELSKYSGILAYRAKSYQNSIQYLTQSAGKITDDPEVFYYLGMDYYGLNKKADSKTNLQRAVNLKLPDDLAAQAKRVLAKL